MTSSGRTIREGIVTGLIAYVAVAAFYAVFDLLAARGAFYTLDLLGRTVFRGLRDPAVLQLPLQHDFGAMFAYNALHLGLALSVGLFVAMLVARLEDRPGLVVPVAFVICAGYVVTIVAVRLLASEITPVLPLWTIVIANTLAAVSGGYYLWRAHPGLWRRVRRAV